MQHVPKGKGRRMGLKPRRSSSGVDGELRMLIRVLRAAAMALWRYKVYLSGRWYGSAERVAVVICRMVRMDRSTRAACSPGGDVWRVMPSEPRGPASDVLTFSQSP